MLLGVRFCWVGSVARLEVLGVARFGGVAMFGGVARLHCNSGTVLLGYIGGFATISWSRCQVTLSCCGNRVPILSQQY